MSHLGGDSFIVESAVRTLGFFEEHISDEGLALIASLLKDQTYVSILMLYGSRQMHDRSNFALFPCGQTSKGYCC